MNHAPDHGLLSWLRRRKTSSAGRYLHEVDTLEPRVLMSAAVAKVAHPRVPPTPTVSIVATKAAASEIGPKAGVFTVTRTGSTATDLTVDYTVGGTASNDGSDFSQLSGVITIPAGHKTATITVTPIDDGVAEGAETVIVTLAPETGYQVSSAKSAAVVTIADSSPTVSMAVIVPFVDEGGGSGVVRISRTGPTTGSLTVNYSVGGTADPDNYNAPDGFVTFAVGDSSVLVTISAPDNGETDGDSSIVLTLISDDTFSVKPGAGQATLTLRNPSVDLIGTGAAGAVGSFHDPDLEETYNVVRGSVTIKNIGFTSSGSFTVSVMLVSGTDPNADNYEEADLADIEVDSVAGGQSLKLSFVSDDVDYLGLDPGQYHLQVVVDSYDEVAETNEDNNIFTNPAKSVTIPQPLDD